MYSSVLSAIVQGLDVTIINVEMDVSNGLPGMQIVGSVATEIKESGERVRTAIKNLGYRLPPRKMVINLTPANVRKDGTGFDLPIAIAILAAHCMIDVRKLKDTVVVGELGLDGAIYGIKGVLPIVNACKKRGIKMCLVPSDNASEASMVEGMMIYGVSHLKDVLDYISGDSLQSYKGITYEKWLEETKYEELDYCDIKGQSQMKRAVQIAVAGRHNMLMIGKSGAGKSMLAKRIPTILPQLTLEESMEISQIYSIMGLLKEEQPFVSTRPFRKVHHTISKVALIGGGGRVKPGELSLAHGGVLFLDELPEFSKSVLEVLRQPLEDKKVHITRSRGSYEFPADVLLVAAMNPCPCGHYPDLNKCTCTEYEINRYLGKISQPLLERIDICVDTPKVEFERLSGTGDALDSATMKDNINRARERQRERFMNEDISYNGEISNRQMEQYCHLDSSCMNLMEQAYERMDLSARIYFKVIKVARTIADLDGDEEIQTRHISEALGYRMFHKTYGRK